MKDLKQFIKTTIREFLNEQHSNDTDLINIIKKSLIMETLVDEDEFNELYNGDWDLAWKNFVDNQENGDCQGIVYGIIYNFKNVKKVFGEIEVDEPYIDEYGDEHNVDEFIEMALSWGEPDGLVVNAEYEKQKLTENPNSYFHGEKYWDREIDGLRVSSSTEFS
jgi:hypothetical protein